MKFFLLALNDVQDEPISDEINGYWWRIFEFVGGKSCFLWGLCWVGVGLAEAKIQRRVEWLDQIVITFFF